MESEPGGSALRQRPWGHAPSATGSEVRSQERAGLSCWVEVLPPHARDAARAAVRLKRQAARALCRRSDSLKRGPTVRSNNELMAAGAWRGPFLSLVPYRCSHELPRVASGGFPPAASTALVSLGARVPTPCARNSARSPRGQCTGADGGDWSPRDGLDDATPGVVRCQAPGLPSVQLFTGIPAPASGALSAARTSRRSISSASA